MKVKLVVDGNFTPFVRAVLCVSGMVVGLLGLRYDSTLITATIGLFIGIVGGYSSRAHLLGIEPFDNSYRKARDSYKENEDK
jgi:uncharacterized membrane protein